MPSRYFPKPQPLSPNTKTWVEEGVRYQKDKRVRGGKRRVKGVPTTDSIYYLWFEYLKRSEKYKSACANNGKGMAKLYKDFGNIFEYEGVEGFWNWWKERGQYLFGIKATQEIVEFDSADEVVGYKDYKLIAIPKNITATTIKKRLNKLVDDMKSELKPTAEQTAKYSIFQTKVDVESLKSCLMAYDLKQKGTDVLEIGLAVRYIKGAKAKYIIEDGRKKGKEIDSQKLIELSEKNFDEYDKILRKAEAIVNKREDAHTMDSRDYDDLVYREMRIFKVDYVRTTRKKSIRTNTHKLINKAVANIQVVEKGMFGVGH